MRGLFLKIYLFLVRMAEFLIVATSHIAAQAIRDVERAVASFAPDAVAVELDHGRFHALLSRQKPDYSPRLIRVVGVKGYLFALLGSWLQRRLGRVVSMEPGAEMLAAARLAQGRRLLLIDRELVLTLRRLHASLGWRELRRFLRDLWESLIRPRRIAFDLSSVPDEGMVALLLAELRERYPRPYRVLVEERNSYMVRLLLRYEELHPEEKVLVVVGAGHAPGLRTLLGEG